MAMPKTINAFAAEEGSFEVHANPFKRQPPMNVPNESINPLFMEISFSCD